MWKKAGEKKTQFQKSREGEEEVKEEEDKEVIASVLGRRRSSRRAGSIGFTLWWGWVHLDGAVRWKRTKRRLSLPPEEQKKMTNKRPHSLWTKLLKGQSLKIPHKFFKQDIIQEFQSRHFDNIAPLLVDSVMPKLAAKNSIHMRIALCPWLKLLSITHFKIAKLRRSNALKKICNITFKQLPNYYLQLWNCFFWLTKFAADCYKIIDSSDFCVLTLGFDYCRHFFLRAFIENNEVVCNDNLPDAHYCEFFFCTVCRLHPLSGIWSYT